MSNYDKSYLVDTMTRKEAKRKKVLPDSKILLVGDNIGGGGTGGAIVGKGEPTKKTQAELGQTYLDEDSGTYYILNTIENGDYLWSKVETETFLENTKYGEVKYYSVWESTYGIQWGDNVTLNRVDADKFSQWLKDNPGAMSEWESTVNFDYRSEGDEQFWQVWTMEEQIIIPADEIYETTGLDLQLEDPEMSWAYCSIEAQVAVDTESEIITVDIIGKKQFESLCFENAHGTATLGRDNVEVISDAIKEVAFERDVVTEIPDYFLKKCVNLTELKTTSTGIQGLGLDKITTIGRDFMYGCYNLQPNVDISGNQWYEVYFQGSATIGHNFMSHLNSEAEDHFFDCKEIRFINVNSVGDYFFSNNRFSGEIKVHGIYSVGDFFCSNTDASKIELGVNVNFTKIPSYFLADNRKLTTLDFDTSRITEIGDNFLATCSNFVGLPFSRPMRFPQVDKIGHGFLSGCSNFNTQLEFPMLRIIGDSFLSGCSNYNQSLALPQVVSVGSSFMQNCWNFTYPFTLDSLVSFGEWFMTNNYNFTGPLTLSKAANFTGNNQVTVLSVDESYEDYPAYQTGITVSGEGRQTILNMGDITSGNFRRKLIDGGSGSSGGGTWGSITGNIEDQTDLYGIIGDLRQGQTDLSGTVEDMEGDIQALQQGQADLYDIVGNVENALHEINNGSES